MNNEHTVDADKIWNDCERTVLTLKDYASDRHLVSALAYMKKLYFKELAGSQVSAEVKVEDALGYYEKQCKEWGLESAKEEKEEWIKAKEIAEKAIDFVRGIINGYEGTGILLFDISSKTGKYLSQFEQTKTETNGQ